MIKYKNKLCSIKKQITKSYTGNLYIVSTPIGNFSDITQRAILILQEVDLIAAEDTNHTSLLLKHFSINTRLFSFHNYNERKKTFVLIEKLKKGENIALVSNSGTPLINDPGYCLVRDCHKIGIRVIPVPGPCAAIAALSASGLSSNHFYYEGFLPVNSLKRQNVLKKLKNKSCTLIFYESTHRLLESLNDMVSVLGVLRYVVLARELTKIWETIYGAPIGELIKWIQENKNRQKGEIVLVVEGCKTKKKLSLDILDTLSLLVKNEISLKKSIFLTSKIYKVKRNDLYRSFLRERNKI